TVGEIHRVRSADHHENQKNIEPEERERIGEEVVQPWADQQIGLELLEERHVHRGRIHAVRVQQQQEPPDHESGQYLQHQLLQRSQTEVSLVADLREIVNESDRAKTHQ